ncbi:hypothetical protein JCM10207_004385 [Rhodosporidiobolus poonsookiae]
MGNLCGKEDHFDALQGKGNTLGSSTAPNNKTTTPLPTTGPGYSTSSSRAGGGKSASTSPPQRLGGAEGGTSPDPGSAERREAMLAAAEARGKAANSRGTQLGGKLASQLQNQQKDGGRAAEARMEAERRGEQLVWD